MVRNRGGKKAAPNNARKGYNARKGATHDGGDNNQRKYHSRWICRYYKRELPAVHSHVMVNISSVDSTGAHVYILEYAKKKAMIPPEYLSKQDSSGQQKLNPGSCHVAQVRAVVGTKVQLALTGINPGTKAEHEEKYRKSLVVHRILKSLVTNKWPLTELYKQVAWPLYSKTNHAYDSFLQSILLTAHSKNKSQIPKDINELKVPQELKHKLKLAILRRFITWLAAVRVQVMIECPHEEVMAIINRIETMYIKTILYPTRDANGIHGTYRIHKLELDSRQNSIYTLSLMYNENDGDGNQCMRKYLNELSKGLTAMGGKMFDISRFECGRGKKFQNVSNTKKQLRNAIFGETRSGESGANANRSTTAKSNKSNDANNKKRTKAKETGGEKAENNVNLDFGEPYDSDCDEFSIDFDDSDEFDDTREFDVVLGRLQEE